MQERAGFRSGDVCEGENQAVSKVVAELLLIALTMLLALLVLLLFSMPNLGLPAPEPPRIFAIKAIYHENEGHPYLLNNDSRIVLVNEGQEAFGNAGLRAEIYVNGVRTRAVIETLNGHSFISTHHYGVQWIGGSGCSGEEWSPGEKIVIDLADNTIRPGDLVRVDVVNRSMNKTVSRDTSRA